MTLLLTLLLSLTPAHAEKLRYTSTVLQGGLIRAGGPGGQRSLPKEILNNLCEQGVSKVYYLYPSINFKTKGSYACSGGKTLDYKGSGFIGGKSVRGILVDIAASLETNRGPVLVHCWNGWHATGEVAAYSLMQFCGWSGERAAKYWGDNIADKGNLPKYGSILKRIKNFVPFSDLRVSEQTKSAACPQ